MDLSTCRSMGFCKRLLSVAIQLSLQVKLAFETTIEKHEVLLDELLRGECLEDVLGNGSTVPSLCFVLGLLLTARCKPLFKDPARYLYLAKSLMLESVTRACTGYLKISKRHDPADHIRHVLSMPKRNVSNSFKLDYDSTAERSTPVFSMNLTNCSPFAIVSCLGFIKETHAGEERRFLDQIMDGKISMRQFLADNYPGETGKLAQTALFIQGISQIRKPMQPSMDTVTDTMAKMTLIAQNAQKREDRNLSKSESRLAFWKQRSRVFQTYHSRVKLFNHAEVAEMNFHRPKDDQVELMESGLLKHHCCYETCPDFLKSFKTASDERRGTRLGIMQHLQYDIRAPSFHVIGRSIAMKCSQFDQFVSMMNAHFMSDKRLRYAYVTRELRDEYLKGLWEYSRILKRYDAK